MPETDLSPEDQILVRELTDDLQGFAARDRLNDQYYEGVQRLAQLGLAVPPELRRFVTVVNWPRVAVDSLEERLDVKSLMLPGTSVGDAGLQEGWNANNLDSEASQAHLDGLIYGRSFVSVGAADGDDLPVIAIESPREVAVKFDPRTKKRVGAIKLFGTDDTTTDPSLALQPRFLTVYRPDYTQWLENDRGVWAEYDRDDHNLGTVPVVPFINRRRTNTQWGVSEMADVINLTDAASRSLTNLQVAGETHAVPGRWVTGMSKGDFVDPATGEMLPTWQAYFGAIQATESTGAKFGQFSASDLRNFHDTVNHYAHLVASVTGLPVRYLGQNSDNPPSADAIRADESRLIKRAERKCASFGDQWGRVFALYVRYRDGEWLDGDRIKVEWHDPATPTFSAKADALQKLHGGEPIISREGTWDELGWDEARKDRERRYFDAEAIDPIAKQILRDVSPSADVVA